MRFYTLRSTTPLSDTHMTKERLCRRHYLGTLIVDSSCDRIGAGKLTPPIRNYCFAAAETPYILFEGQMYHGNFLNKYIKSSIRIFYDDVGHTRFIDNCIIYLYL